MMSMRGRQAVLLLALSAPPAADAAAFSPRKNSVGAVASLIRPDPIFGVADLGPRTAAAARFAHRDEPSSDRRPPTPAESGFGGGGGGGGRRGGYLESLTASVALRAVGGGGPDWSPGHKGAGGMADTRMPDTHVDEDPRKSISAAPSFEEYMKQRSGGVGSASAPAAPAPAVVVPAPAPAPVTASPASPAAPAAGRGGGYLDSLSSGRAPTRAGGAGPGGYLDSIAGAGVSPPFGTGMTAAPAVPAPAPAPHPPAPVPPPLPSPVMPPSAPAAAAWSPGHKGAGGMADTRMPDTYQDKDTRKSISSAPSFEEYMKQRSGGVGAAPAAPAHASAAVVPAPAPAPVPAAPVTPSAASADWSPGIKGSGGMADTRADEDPRKSISAAPSFEEYMKARSGGVGAAAAAAPAPAPAAVVPAPAPAPAPAAAADAADRSPGHGGAGGTADTRMPGTYRDADPRKSISAAPSFEEYVKARSGGGAPPPAAVAPPDPAAAAVKGGAEPAEPTTDESGTGNRIDGEAVTVGAGVAFLAASGAAAVADAAGGLAGLLNALGS